VVRASAEVEFLSRRSLAAALEASLANQELAAFWTEDCLHAAGAGGPAGPSRRRRRAAGARRERPSWRSSRRSGGAARPRPGAPRRATIRRAR
jgi:hypothetical protein